jgi:hypothetical protein
VDLTAIASRRHYLAHILPVWDALGGPGRLQTDRDLLRHPEAAERGARPVQRGQGPAIVAGWFDLFRARRLGYGPFVLMQHGAGQSYHGDRRSAGNPSYAGAPGMGDVRLFVVPGADPAARWRAAYPEAAVAMVGNVKPLPARVPDDERTVAVTFHWPCGLVPETGSAWRDFRGALPALAERYRVIGHWHPRWGDEFARQYERVGIEPVASLDDVARRADVLVADNTSALFEWAATDRPVVLLNSPRYRRHVRHGMRFWDLAHVGLQVDEPGRLMDTVRMALVDPTGVRLARREVVRVVYAGGGAADAAEAIGRAM